MMYGVKVLHTHEEHDFICDKIYSTREEATIEAERLNFEMNYWAGHKDTIVVEIETPTKDMWHDASDFRL